MVNRMGLWNVRYNNDDNQRFSYVNERHFGFMLIRGKCLHKNWVINHTLLFFDKLCKRKKLQNKPQKGFANGKIKTHFFL